MELKEKEGTTEELNKKYAQEMYDCRFSFILRVSVILVSR